MMIKIKLKKIMLLTFLFCAFIKLNLAVSKKYVCTVFVYLFLFIIIIEMNSKLHAFKSRILFSKYFVLAYTFY
jgi:hypothetical protein